MSAVIKDMLNEYPDNKTLNRVISRYRSRTINSLPKIAASVNVVNTPVVEAIMSNCIKYHLSPLEFVKSTRDINMLA